MHNDIGLNLFRMRIVAAVFVGVTILICVVIWKFGGRRIVGRAVAPDGTEMQITQTFTWGGDLFNTGFTYRKPGGLWDGFYFDHEDSYWAKSRVQLNTNSGVALFYRGNSIAVTFDWRKEIYTLHRLGRVVTNSPSQLPQ
ncbi:MAG TPA: hypothetical protein EYQ50_04405 [Verrucomicrobiales bacterium]|jgi:hypothetical protein|nr:hypothetical protein [Verrucomicrobiales bacterium]HIL70781.1 hypothetical protein [Verrucomicrobiota bacterium]